MKQTLLTVFGHYHKSKFSIHASCQELDIQYISLKWMNRYIHKSWQPYFNAIWLCNILHHFNNTAPEYLIIAIQTIPHRVRLHITGVYARNPKREVTRYCVSTALTQWLNSLRSIHSNVITEVCYILPSYSVNCRFKVYSMFYVISALLYSI